jgi:hypothetical protein
VKAVGPAPVSVSLSLTCSSEKVDKTATHGSSIPAGGGGGGREHKAATAASSDTESDTEDEVNTAATVPPTKIQTTPIEQGGVGTRRGEAEAATTITAIPTIRGPPATIALAPAENSIKRESKRKRVGTDRFGVDPDPAEGGARGGKKRGVIGKTSDQAEKPVAVGQPGEEKINVSLTIEQIAAKLVGVYLCAQRACMRLCWCVLTAFYF